MLKQMMIPLWKKILRKNFNQIDQLADFLQLSSSQKELLLTSPRFVLNVPVRLAEKMEKGNPEDPLFKQFVSSSAENIISSGFMADPVGDQMCRTEKKLLHKYEGRVLLLCTSACAMHCRYCFRQNFDYDVAHKGFDNELAHISADSTINEVILSGGDPLSLDNSILSVLLNQLSKIPHIRKIRFHTRFPIGIPERIDDEFLNLLKSLPIQIWFVIHSNHPKELDKDVLVALKRVQCLGIPILNQSVLLKGINDDVDILTELNHLLVNNGIMPYYLHQLDKVLGTDHFEVSEEVGKALISALRKRLPGFAVPKYVREIYGMASKTEYS